MTCGDTVTVGCHRFAQPFAYNTRHLLLAIHRATWDLAELVSAGGVDPALIGHLQR
jgi:hypothetical protein